MGALPSRGDGGGLPSLLMEGACGPSCRPPPPPPASAPGCGVMCPAPLEAGNVLCRRRGGWRSRPWPPPLLFPDHPSPQAGGAPPLYILHVTLEGLFSSFLFSLRPLGHLFVYSAAPRLGTASTGVASTREGVPRPRVGGAVAKRAWGGGNGGTASGKTGSRSNTHWSIGETPAACPPVYLWSMGARRPDKRGGEQKEGGGERTCARRQRVWCATAAAGRSTLRPHHHWQGQKAGR